MWRGEEIHVLIKIEDVLQGVQAIQGGQLELEIEMIQEASNITDKNQIQVKSIETNSAVDILLKIN